MRLPKISVVFIFLFFFCTIGFINPKETVKAATPEEMNTAYTDCLEGKKTNFECMIGVANDANKFKTACDIIGTDRPDDNCNTLLKTSGGKSAVAKISESVADMYMLPANTDMYIASVLDNAGIITPAYAQFGGIGGNGLQFLLKLWRGMRNVAYAFLVIILVAVGFMIMMRRRLDPRTVMTVQNSLPKIITTLILVTFSYAIAGLMIDLLYVFIGITYFALNSSQDVLTQVTAISQSSFSELTTVNSSVVFSAVGNIFSLFWGGAAEIAAGALIQTGVGSVVGFLLVGVAGAIVGLFAGLLLPLLIVALAYLFAVIRLWITLLNAYIQVLLLVIFAPIYIMLGAIPGMNGFGMWIRNLIGNLSTFFITAVFVFMGSVISKALGNTDGAWVAPGLKNNATSLAGIIAFGLYLAIPSVAATAKKALGAQSLGGGIGGMLFGPVGTLMGAAQQTYQMLSMRRQRQG